MCRWWKPPLTGQGRVRGLGAREQDGSNARPSGARRGGARARGGAVVGRGAAVVGFMRLCPRSSRVAVYALSLTAPLVERIGPRPRHGSDPGGALSVAPDQPLTRQFGAAMAKRGSCSDLRAHVGLPERDVLVEVLRRAGANPTPAAVYSTLEKMTDVDIGGYRLAYGPNRHHGSNFIEITVVDQNGRFVR